MSEQQTCGKGLAARSALPSRVSDLMSALAEILALHQQSIDKSDADGRGEVVTYVRLEGHFRTIASLLRSTAGEMAAARDLPMARHDVALLGGPGNREVFERFIQLETELAALLQTSIEQDRLILADMRAR
jgi:hypothetical protein